jgi:hypothetical protein
MNNQICYKVYHCILIASIETTTSLIHVVLKIQVFLREFSVRTLCLYHPLKNIF